MIGVPIKCPPGYAPDKFGKCRPIWGGGYNLDGEIIRTLDELSTFDEIPDDVLNDLEEH